eukprot:s812_g6.t1
MDHVGSGDEMPSSGAKLMSQFGTVDTPLNLMQAGSEPRLKTPKPQKRSREFVQAVPRSAALLREILEPILPLPGGRLKNGNE